MLSLPPPLFDLQQLLDKISQQMPSIYDEFDYIRDKFNDLTEGIFNSVVDYLKGVLSNFKDKIIELYERVSKVLNAPIKCMYNFVKNIFDAVGSVYAALLSFIKTVLYLILQYGRGTIIVGSVLSSYMVDAITNYAYWTMWNVVRHAINRVLKVSLNPPNWLSRELKMQLGTAIASLMSIFPATFWLQGELEFMRTGVWDLTTSWTWAGYDVFELVTIVKRWKCWPVTVKYKRIEKKAEKNITESINNRLLEPKKMLPIVVYNRYKGYKNNAYNIGYMLEKLLNDYDIRIPSYGKDTAPAYGLFVSSYGCNLIYHPTPIARRLVKLDCTNSKLYEFYKDDLGRIWVKFDAYGTFDDAEFSLIENYDKSSNNCVRLSETTWIDEGVKSVIELMEGDLRFVSIKLRVRAKRLFNDIKTLLYHVLWSKNLRINGIRVSQVPATPMHLDCIERHYRFFETI